MRRTSRLDDAYAYCETLLRDHDKDRFLASLFLPAAARRHVNALHAFSFEVARVREVVREPMAGKIRHQWWWDTIQGKGRGEAEANPIAAVLLDTIARFDLPLAPLIALIEARGFDLYDEPMPNLAALESYSRDTSGALFQLAAYVLSAAPSQPSSRSIDDEIASRAAFHGGCAHAFTGLIRALRLHAARGQIYLPGDILARHGASRDNLVSGRVTHQLIGAVAAWRDEARRHLGTARVAVTSLPDRVKPAFLPLVLVERYLRLTERSDYDPLRSPIELPQWRRQWALWRGS
jgi:15-cis-phytoene synthase